MGQSINVLLYGCRVPSGVDVYSEEDSDILERWRAVVRPKVEAYEARLSKKTHRSWGLAGQAYEPETPTPDDADADDLIGFYVCRGHNDDGESHRFPSMTFAEMRTTEPMATILRRCRRRWSRFARWARAQGVEFGKPRIWRTRTEVA